METRGKDFMVAMGFCRRVAGDLRVTLDAVEVETNIPGLRAYAVTPRDAAIFMLKVTDALPMLCDISQGAKDFYDEMAPDFIDKTDFECMQNPSEEDDLVAILGAANAVQTEMNKFFQRTYELVKAGRNEEATDFMLTSFGHIKELLGILDYVSPEAIKFYEDTKAAA